MNKIPNLPYATHDGQTLLLDLHLPAPSPTPIPLVVSLPGGGWYACEKEEAEAPFLIAAGFAVAAINYRVSSEAIAPANIQDCLAAVRWARAHAADYNLDFHNIGVFGASAGGHLAALLGMSGGVAEFLTSQHAGLPSGVRAICDFCGPSDLTQIALPEQRDVFARLYEVTSSYLGGPVEERGQLARLMSPLTYAGPAIPPIMIVHGDADPVVPVSESIRLHAALQQAGADTSLTILPGASHGWDWAITNPMVTDFFRRTLSLPTAATVNTMLP